MNFSQIKCFLAAADCLNFTKAADRLYLSQPVLSRQIAAMEDELGIELFIREKKSVKLTPAGELMASGLKKLTFDYTSLLDKASALHKGLAGVLNIGMIEGQLFCSPYSDAMTAFHDAHPDVRVNLSSHSISGLIHALVNGDVDIGFAASFNVAGYDELDYMEVGTAKTYLVVPRSHPLAEKENLTIDDFKDDIFLTLPPNESQQINRTGSSGRFRTLEAPSIGALALWLEAGYGIFPLNINHSLRNNPNLVFKDIPGLGESTEVVAWNKDNKNPLVKLFTEKFETLKK